MPRDLLNGVFRKVDGLRGRKFYGKSRRIHPANVLKPSSPTGFEGL